uniref:Pco155588b n=1 Tax=Arundo donax TaxID=35708 RepID=A0A0A9GFC2_ARUDO
MELQHTYADARAGGEINRIRYAIPSEQRSNA